MRVVAARPPSFTTSTITYTVVVYAPAERADTLPLFLFYPYVLCGGLHQEAESEDPPFVPKERAGF
jgi:hypothetical protein